MGGHKQVALIEQSPWTALTPRVPVNTGICPTPVRISELLTVPTKGIASALLEPGETQHAFYLYFFI